MEGWSAAAFASKTLFYKGYNFVMFGLYDREGERYKQYEAGLLSDDQFWGGLAADAALSGGALVLTTSATVFKATSAAGGTFAAKLGAGAFGQSLGKLVAPNLTMSVTFAGVPVVSAAGLNFLSADGKSVNPGDINLTGVGMMTAAGMGLGYVGVKAAQGMKWIWSTVSKGTTGYAASVRLVETIAQPDVNKLAGTLADSTGGHILADAGGTLVNKVKNILIPLPKAESMSLLEAKKWLVENGAKIPSLLNSDTSLYEQAYGAMHLRNELVLAARNALRDGSQTLRLNEENSLLIWDDLIERYAQGKVAGASKGLAGDALYTKIIKDMSDKTLLESTMALKNGFCFAAGTLIHTERGLVPIEEIRIGDRVLSKPEDGIGDMVYKPVVRLMQTENVPVCMVKCLPLDVLELAQKAWRAIRESEVTYLVVTNDHPFWVEGKGWVPSEDLGSSDIFLLENGRHAKVYASGGGAFTAARPIYHIPGDPIGWTVYNDEYGDDESTYIKGFDLSSGMMREPGGRTPPDRDNYLGWHRDHRISYTCTVYNFEVADTHTYFVGDIGVWVHNSNCPVTDAAIAKNVVPLARLYRLATFPA